MFLQDIFDMDRREIVSSRGELSDKKHLLMHSAGEVTVWNSKNEHFSCGGVVCSTQIHLSINRALRQITVTVAVANLALLFPGNMGHKDSNIQQ